MKARWAIGAVLLALALSAGVWWFSPWWVLHQVKAAAERNDAQAVSDVIDYPRLRESLKAELNTALSSRLREGASRLGEVGRTGATIGAALASALVEKLVEGMVRPEFVIQAIRDGQIVLPGRAPNERERGASTGSPSAGSPSAGSPSAGSPSAGSPSAGGGPDAAGQRQSNRFQWRPERVSADRMIVWVSRTESAGRSASTPASEFGLVFERRGFINWKLCAVRLPTAIAGGR